jgi:hypothetical protein
MSPVFSPARQEAKAAHTAGEWYTRRHEGREVYRKRRRKAGTNTPAVKEILYIRIHVFPPKADPQRAQAQRGEEKRAFRPDLRPPRPASVFVSASQPKSRVRCVARTPSAPAFAERPQRQRQAQRRSKDMSQSRRTRKHRCHQKCRAPPARCPRQRHASAAAPARRRRRSAAAACTQVRAGERQAQAGRHGSKKTQAASPPCVRQPRSSRGSFAQAGPSRMFCRWPASTHKMPTHGRQDAVWRATAARHSV